MNYYFRIQIIKSLVKFPFHRFTCSFKRYYNIIKLIGNIVPIPCITAPDPAAIIIPMMSPTGSGPSAAAAEILTPIPKNAYWAGVGKSNFFNL
ncbi:hypothetical protein AYJ08_00695 [Brevibacillus sp. SKDU10]|nr:hypothetical protein AYJ08_00695 [Brevibacillus sp. SKDU10]